MREEFSFDTYKEMLKKWKELEHKGIQRKNVQFFVPHPVHGFEDEILDKKPSSVRYFTLCGALMGLIFGFWFTMWTSYDWPIVTGGKPIASIPPYIVIAYELTILFGCVISFIGFLFLARMPSVANIISQKDYGNKFVIIVDLPKEMS
jgi:radical SAM superfamily enzyme YgiQ (UPF0313 family)